MKITKEMFCDYENVRKSGKTNMFNVGLVESLSGLDRKHIIDIMSNYDRYKKEFGDGK